MLRSGGSESFEATGFHTQKKTKHYKEQDPEKVKAYLEAIALYKPEQIAYVDESGIDSYLYREYGWSPRGQQLIGEVSGHRYRRVGIVAAKLGHEIIAPLVFDGTMDHSLFERWFSQCLLPALPDHAVIVMDNASFHRKKMLNIFAQKAHRSLLFLPPYSPELNPIEHFWCWLKRRLSKLLPDYPSFDDALFDIFQVN